MELRGPILVINSLSLLVSVGVLRHLHKQDEVVPTSIETVAAQRAECEARGVDTPIGRLGCDAQAQGKTPWRRRSDAGGALFLSGGGN